MVEKIEHLFRTNGFEKIVLGNVMICMIWAQYFSINIISKWNMSFCIESLILIRD